MSIHARRDFLARSGLYIGASALTSGLVPGFGLQAAFASDLVDPLAPR